MEGNVHPGIAALTPYQPGKPVEELTRELGITDIVKLASNENPRGPGELVIEALEVAMRSLSRYPDGNGFRLKQALARRFDISDTQLTLGNGSNDVLDLVARIALTPGSEAIISEHAFVVYRLATVSCGGKLIEVPAQNYGCDLAGFLAAVTEKTSIIFIANPNNPTGTWVSSRDLEAFLDALPQRVWVVLDEAYAEYVESMDYPDGVALQRRYPNLIVTRTFSKIHGLASMRVGYSISTAEVADLLNRVRQPFNVNALALAAAEAALADQEFLESSRTLNHEGMQTLLDGFAALGLPSIPAAGNFLCVEVPGPGLPIYQALLAEGVIVRPVAEYGLPNHLRITIGLPAENDRLLETLARVLPSA